MAENIRDIKSGDYVVYGGIELFSPTGDNNTVKILPKFSNIKAAAIKFKKNFFSSSPGNRCVVYKSGPDSSWVLHNDYFSDGTNTAYGTYDPSSGILNISGIGTWFQEPDKVYTWFALFIGDP